MNQILAVGKPAGREQKKTADISPYTRKLVIFFACTILVFGAILGGVYGYNLFMRIQPQYVYTEPVVYFDRIGNEIAIRVEYQSGIQEVAYFWDETHRTEEDMRSVVRTDFSKMIPIASGRSTLTVEVTDSEGRTRTFRKTITNLEINLVGNGSQIEIVAINDEGLEHIIFWLNNGEETIIESDPENPEKIDKTINISDLDLERGDNILTAIAVDLEGNETERTQTFQGQEAPIISGSISEDGFLTIRIVHDMGFERIEVAVNQNSGIIERDNEHFDLEGPIFEIRLPLESGENTVRIVAYSTEGTVSEIEDVIVR